MDISAQLTIRAIRARGLNVTLDRPIETASGVMKTTPLVLVDLETQEGITRHSYVRCYTPLALQPLVQLIANLEGLLTGETAAPVPVEEKLQRHFRLLGPQGLTGIAMGGIDMALWDARAKYRATEIRDGTQSGWPSSKHRISPRFAPCEEPSVIGSS